MIRLFLILFFIGSFLSGSSTEIEGQNKDYAGRTIQFYKYADPVSMEKVPAFSVDFDVNGDFKVQVEINQSTFVFSEFGIYKGNLILVPGDNIELLLPPFREKSFAERKNPYFSPLEFWFATGTGNHSVDVISSFDDRLSQLSDKYFRQLYYDRSQQAFDSVKTILDAEFNLVNDKIVVQHQQLQLKAIEADAFRLSSSKLTPLLTKTKSEYWNFPAFISLFDKAYAGKLNFEAQSVQGKAIHNAIANVDISFLKGFIEEKYGAAGKFSDLVLLKLLHDGFYSGSFSEESILKFFNTDYLRENSDRVIRQIAVNVYEKLIHLRVGTKSPVICLKDINGHNVCTTDDNRQFKYLVFADTEMVVVREQLKYLTRIHELYGKYLSIYIILLKTDLIEMKRFLVEQSIPGVHLVDGNGEFIKEYNVRTFPTCYLLNAKHEIVFRDTKAPLDGFEQQFGSYLRDFLFRQQR